MIEKEQIQKIMIMQDIQFEELIKQYQSEFISHQHLYGYIRLKDNQDLEISQKPWLLKSEALERRLLTSIYKTYSYSIKSFGDTLYTANFNIASEIFRSQSKLYDQSPYPIDEFNVSAHLNTIISLISKLNFETKEGLRVLDYVYFFRIDYDSEDYHDAVYQLSNFANIIEHILVEYKGVKSSVIL